MVKKKIHGIEVLKFVALGKSNKQIAELIGISECTVKNHFSQLMKKIIANDLILFSNTSEIQWVATWVFCLVSINFIHFGAWLSPCN
jgi:hypothetical protein